MTPRSKKIRFWAFYHLGIALFTLVVSAMHVIKYDLGLFSIRHILHAGILFIICISVGYTAIFMARVGARWTHQQLRKRIIPTFLAFVAAAYLISNILITLYVLGHYLANERDLTSFLPNLFEHELSHANSNLGPWMLVIAAGFFYVLWNKSSKKEQTLREQMLEFQYQKLKSQVNPHFLFNSFNALSELVYKDAKKADSYIQKLSGIYRYVLENEKVELVTLTEELQFVTDFFELQAQRDEDKIQLVIDIESPDDYSVIPVSIQMLVENALKHNAVSREKPLIIKIYEEDGYVAVANNVQKKSIVTSTTQTGLKNLEERVKLKFDEEMIVADDGRDFIVKLPKKKHI